MMLSKLSSFFRFLAVKMTLFIPVLQNFYFWGAFSILCSSLGIPVFLILSNRISFPYSIMGLFPFFFLNEFTMNTSLLSFKQQTQFWTVCYEQWPPCYLIQCLFFSPHRIRSFRSSEHFDSSIVLEALSSLSFNDIIPFCFPLYLSCYFLSSVGSGVTWSLMSEVFKNQIKTLIFFPINFYLKILQIYYKEKSIVIS